MPLPVQAWCHEVREAERMVQRNLDSPINSGCAGLAAFEVAEYLELVARNLALSS
jgi:hypothetical protein